MMLLAENARTAVSAAIRRATFAAHQDVAALDAEGIASLDAIYRTAAGEISARIKAHAGPDGNLALAELQSALSQVNGTLADLERRKNVLLQDGLARAAALGVKPYTAANGVQAVIDAAATITIPGDALAFVRGFVANDGLQLSDRVWRIDQHARELVASRIQQAVIQGRSASEAAREFIARGLAVPAELRAKIGDAAADQLAAQAGAALLKGPGAPLENAKRLFRTEINRAHGEAYMKAGEGTPGFAGWRYLLSPAHPEPDICDLLSSQNLYGLGSGVYPDRARCPWPAHPNTLSFIVIVFQEEISEADKGGKQTPLEALAKLTIHQQRGVLGAGKLQLLGAGKLTQGMIRTPLKPTLQRVTALENAKTKAQLKAAAKAAEAAKKAAAVAERAKQAAALASLDKIDGAKKGFEYQAWMSLGKSGALKGLKNSEKLDQVLALAAELKQKKATSDALSKYKSATLSGKKPPPAAAKVFDALPAKEQADFLAKIEAAKQKAAQEAAAAGNLRFADLEQVGPQRGSNPGGLYRNRYTGDEWYVKMPASEDVARNEVLAGALYRAAGIEVPELRLIDARGKPAVASKIVRDVQADAKLLRAGKAQGVADGFAIDAWLGNWDVVGLNFDNLLLKEGRAVRVDVGGALRYRAQGGLKGSAWSPTVRELETLRNPQSNPQTAAVFRHVSEAQLKASAARLQAIADDDIRRLVKEFGPVDPKENARLADTLVARRDDILRRVRPDDVPAPLPADAGARVTAAEQRTIVESRLNGYVLPSDKGDIEDQHVLVWIEKDAQGRARTVAQFKTTGDATASLDRLLAASNADIKFDDKGLGDRLVEAVRGLGSQTNKGLEIRAKDIERVAAVRAELAKFVQATKDAELRGAFERHFEPWVAALEHAIAAGEGKPAAWKAPTSGSFKPFQPPRPKPAEDALPFERKAGDFERKQVERGFAVGTAETSYRAGHYFEAELGDATLRYWPGDSGVPLALRNQVQVLVAGEGVASSERVFDVFKRLGISSERATAIDREELYLRQIAYHRNEALADFNRVASAHADPVERVEALRQWLSTKAGRDITASPTYRPEGRYQAFGQGRVHTFRPDLEGKDWEAFQRDYRVIHKITQGDLVGSIEAILNSGGQMAPTTEKLRRGLPVGGMSPQADLDSGGGSYTFTRIRPRDRAMSEGDLIWRGQLVGRLDAISYAKDNYGRTSGTFVRDNRQSTVADWRKVSRNGGNETNFKNGLSIFDDLEHILGSPDQVRRLIDVFRRHGYSAWLDRRPLEEVIRVRGTV